MITAAFYRNGIGHGGNADEQSRWLVLSVLAFGKASSTTKKHVSKQLSYGQIWKHSYVLTMTTWRMLLYICLMCILLSVRNVPQSHMETTSDTKYKEGLVATRNDSGLANGGDDGVLIKDNFAGTSISDRSQIAVKSSRVNDKGTESISKDRWGSGGGFGARIDTQGVGKVIADDCISPRTRTPDRSPLSIPNELDALEDAKRIASSAGVIIDPPQRTTPLQLVQPSDKGDATVGWIQKRSIRDVDTTFCVESQWHRHRLSRLFSYPSSSTSSSEDSDDIRDANIPPRSTDSESPEGWMMAEDEFITPKDFRGSHEGSTGSSAGTGSTRKSSKFVRFSTASQKGERTSKDSLRPSIGSIKDARFEGAARPSRHWSYGATLDLPPMGVQSHRCPASSTASVNEAVHEAELVVQVAPPTLRELQVELDRRDRARATFRKWTIISLFSIVNAVLLGSSLLCIFRPPTRNESRFAVGRLIPDAVKELIRHRSSLPSPVRSGCAYFYKSCRFVVAVGKRSPVLWMRTLTVGT